MMKTLRILFLAMMAVSIQSALFADEDKGSIEEKLAQLQKQLEEQNARIAAMQTELEQSRLETGVAQEKADGPVVSLGNGSDNLKIKADLRVRYEQNDWANEPNGVNRNRWFRQRFRLGMDFTTPHGWTAKAGLATGEYTGPTSGSDGATSTNDTYGQDSEFETGDVGLDYAYAQHTWKDTTVTIGQQHNPYYSTEYLWDADVRPVGVVVQQAIGPAFVTVGAHDVRYAGANNAEGLMGAVQGGIKLEQDNLKSTLAAAYYRYNDEYSTTVGLAPYGYNFELLTFYGDATFEINDNANVMVFGEWLKNLGAAGPDGNGQRGGNIDPKDNDMHFALGVGSAIDRYSVKLSYVSTEADALPDNLNDADMGRSVAGTDINGVELNLGVKLLENCNLEFSYLTYERVDEFDFDEHGVANNEGELYQIDLKYKF